MFRDSRNRGFTLAEVLIACVILAFAVLSITQMIVAGQMQTYEALHHRRGQSLAEAMMDEILALPYADPEAATGLGPDAGESNRAYYDNMDDYHGLTEAAGAIEDAQGLLYGGAFDRFSRSVAVAAATETVTGFADPVAGLEIAVTVTDDRGMTWVVNRFIPDPAL